MEGKLIIEKKEYTKLGMIGEGGAGKVFIVQDQDKEIYALKEVKNYDDPIMK